MHDQSTNITLKDIKKEVIDTLTAKYRLGQLTAIEFSARVGGSLVLGLTILVIALIVLQFSSLSLAYYLGDIYNSQTLGFATVGGIYLVLLLCFQFFFRQLALKKTTDLLVKIITHALNDHHE